MPSKREKMLVEMIVDSMIVVCSNVREYVSDLSHQRETDECYNW